MTEVNVIPFVSPVRDERDMQERILYYLTEFKAIEQFDFSLTSPDTEQSETNITLCLVLSPEFGSDKAH